MRILRYCLIALTAAIVVCFVVPVYMGDRVPRAFTSEMFAMRTLVALQTAEAQYCSQYGTFADSLQKLASADLGLPSDLAQTNEGGGYRFTLSRSADGYTIHAVPTQYGTTGIRNFFSDETLAIHHHYGPEPATTSDPLVK